MTLQEIFDRVTRTVRGTTLLISDVADSINECQNELVDLLEMEATADENTSPSFGPTVVNQTAYTLPTDCYLPRYMQWYLDSNYQPLTFIDQIDVYRDRIAAYGPIQSDPIRTTPFYTIWNGQVLLGPPPSTAGQSLKLDYYAIPAAVVSTTPSGSPGMPSRYHRTLLVPYACMRAYEDAGEGEWSKYYRSRYETSRDRLRGDRDQNQRISPPRVRVARGW